jgi:hypothetical protein
MMTDVTGPARDELDLPTPVRHLLDIGRAQLAELRAAAEAERERAAKEEAGRFAAVVPDTLVQYVDWQEQAFRDAAAVEPPTHHGVKVSVPGCVALTVTVRSTSTPGK